MNRPSALREAADEWIETGRAIGHFERLRSVVEYLDQQRNLLRAEGHERVAEALDNWRTWLAREVDALDRNQRARREAAERLLVLLEHPGARLARRLLAAIHGARAGWQRG